MGGELDVELIKVMILFLVVVNCIMGAKVLVVWLFEFVDDCVMSFCMVFWVFMVFVRNDWVCWMVIVVLIRSIMVIVLNMR